MTAPRKGKKPRPFYRCERCHARRSEHGSDDACPDGGGQFRQREHKAHCASQSFTADEVRALEHILKSVQRGGRVVDLSALSRSPLVHSIARKTATMKRRIETLKQPADLPPTEPASS